MKNDFLYQKVEKSSQQHCWEWQDAPPCSIWAHYNKLCHKYGHNYIIWHENHESSYTIVYFVKTFCFLLPYYRFLIFTVNTSTHISTPCERISFFEVFFIFFYLFQNGSKWSTWLFIERGWIFQHYHRFHYVISNMYLNKIFRDL